MSVKSHLDHPRSRSARFGWPSRVSMLVFRGWRLSVVFLMLAFIIGASAGIVLIVFFKKKGKDSMPFGPAMAVGAYVAAVAGNDLITWYMTTLFHG